MEHYYLYETFLSSKVRALDYKFRFPRFLTTSTAQKMKFSVKDFFSKCDQIRSFLWIWSHLRKKSLIENFIFCAVSCLAGMSTVVPLEKLTIILTLLAPCISESCIKIKINSIFHFQTSLWCLKRFYEGFKGLHKTFWGNTKKCENKIFLCPGSGREGLR